jgi:nucleotide-binding universal stress UspA family protein
MTAKKINQILCAVRGGPESRETVTYAIDLALETGARLTFFHALDAEFLNHATIGPLSIVYQELVEMGKFTMLILCDRAQRRGVAEVNYVVWEGNIHKQLNRAAIETKAEVMVMGRPMRGPTHNAFRHDEMEAFAAELAKKGQLQLILVPQDENPSP